METKSVREWELEKGFMLRDLGELTEDSQLTEEQFMSHWGSNDHHVDHAERTAFLQNNGYEVTRANMMDPALSAKPKEQSA